MPTPTPTPTIREQDDTERILPVIAEAVGRVAYEADEARRQAVYEEALLARLARFLDAIELIGELADAPATRKTTAYSELWGAAFAVREVSYTGQSACLASADKAMDAAMLRFIQDAAFIMGYWEGDGTRRDFAGAIVLSDQAGDALWACGIDVWRAEDASATATPTPTPVPTIREQDNAEPILAPGRIAYVEALLARLARFFDALDVIGAVVDAAPELPAPAANRAASELARTAQAVEHIQFTGRDACMTRVDTAIDAAMLHYTTLADLLLIRWSGTQSQTADIGGRAGARVEDAVEAWGQAMEVLLAC